MIMIFAGNNNEAQELRRALHLKPGQWAYLGSIQKLARQRPLLLGDDPPRVLYYGTYAKRADYEEIEAALFHLGATREIVHYNTVRNLLRESDDGETK